VIPRRVRFTETAQQHVRREKAWWIENRIHRDVFAAEFDEALRLLALLPGAGTVYSQAGMPGVRRLYVPKVKHSDVRY
jgi:plasmid stabilization system protein ParE